MYILKAMYIALDECQMHKCNVNVVGLAVALKKNWNKYMLIILMQKVLVQNPCVIALLKTSSLTFNYGKHRGFSAGQWAICATCHH